MTEKEIKKLSRLDLLRMLLERTKEVEALRSLQKESEEGQDLQDTEEKPAVFVNENENKNMFNEPDHKVKVENTLPDSATLENIIKKEKRRPLSGGKVYKVIIMTVVVLSAFILVFTLMFPMLQIYGDSMNPTLNDGDIVISLKTGKYKKGDVIAFYYNNKILVKRVIATSGDMVSINDEGRVYVNNVLLDEPYIQDFSYGEGDIVMPFTVPEDRLFVVGDKRDTSVDSRYMAVGCVAEEQVVGKLAFRILPVGSMGTVK